MPVNHDRTQAPGEPFVLVQNVSKKYGDLLVLDDVSFTVQRGEVKVIIGPSGSGKSTILRCIARLEAIEHGSITVDAATVVRGTKDSGRRVQLRKIPRASHDIGMVFQSFNLFPHMTVLDNVTLAPRLVTKLPREKAETIAKELLDRVGLSDKLGNYPAELSGGQQQRAAIARALAMSPKVVLFDEVTSALDPELVGEVLRVMRQLASEGMTMIVVSHEMGFVRDVADQVIMIDGGRIVEEGPTKQLFAHPRQERTRAFFNQLRERTQ